MNLKVVSIHNHGNASAEYVLLEATSDTNLKYYMIADTTYTSTGNISNKLRHTFWFGTHDIKQGELVVLRTGTGTNDTFTNTAGKVVHRFYWGLGSAVWNNTGDAAMLFNISSWNTTKAK